MTQQLLSWDSSDISKNNIDYFIEILTKIDNMGGQKNWTETFQAKKEAEGISVSNININILKDFVFNESFTPLGMAILQQITEADYVDISKTNTDTDLYLRGHIKLPNLKTARSITLDRFLLPKNEKDFEDQLGNTNATYSTIALILEATPKLDLNEYQLSLLNGIKGGVLKDKNIYDDAYFDDDDGLPFSKLDNEIQGFYKDGISYIIADNVKEEDLLSVILQELGAHAGMEKLLGKEKYNNIIKQIDKWSKSNEDTPEVSIAKAAVQRVDLANTIADNRDAELIAYFIEIAVQQGYTPKNTEGIFQRILTAIWNSVEKILKELDIDTSKLKAEDIVNLAYGAAMLEVNQADFVKQYTEFNKPTVTPKEASEKPTGQQEETIESLQAKINELTTKADEFRDLDIDPSDILEERQVLINRLKDLKAKKAKEAEVKKEEPKTDTNKTTTDTTEDIIKSYSEKYNDKDKKDEYMQAVEEYIEGLGISILNEEC